MLPTLSSDTYGHTFHSSVGERFHRCAEHFEITWRNIPYIFCDYFPFKKESKICFNIYTHLPLACQWDNNHNQWQPPMFDVWLELCFVLPICSTAIQYVNLHDRHRNDKKMEVIVPAVLSCIHDQTLNMAVMGLSW